MSLAQGYVDTFKLFFDLNVASLNKNTEKKIDLLIYNDKIMSGGSVKIVGYADYLGSENYNKGLSQERAKNVKDYLVKNGLTDKDITMCTGKGQVRREEKLMDKDGSPDDRRVDIVVDNKIIRRENVMKTRSRELTSSKEKANEKGKKNGGGSGNTGSNPKKTTSSTTPSVVKADLKDLTTLKEGQTIKLENVYFWPGRHVIRPESYPTLEKLYTVLLQNPYLKISIEGHVCCVHDVPDALDSDTDEPILSVNRARAIYQYLIDKGIDYNRLQFVGFGKSHPVVAMERNEEDAEKNRRVEIRVVSNKP